MRVSKRLDRRYQGLGIFLRKGIILVGLFSLVTCHFSPAFGGEYDALIDAQRQIIAQDSQSPVPEKGEPQHRRFLIVWSDLPFPTKNAIMLRVRASSSDG